MTRDSRPSLPPYAAIVLCGGRSRRMGGGDKTALDVGGASLLERVLAAVQDAEEIVVVGRRRPVAGREVRWTREDPPGGGPVAAVASGLDLVTTEVCTVFAGDLPFAQGLAGTLRSTLHTCGAEAVIPIDEEGREQPLAAVYRSLPLREALRGLEAAGLEAAGGEVLRDDDTHRTVTGCRTPGPTARQGLGGVAFRAVLTHVRVQHLASSCLPAAALRDVDTPRDLMAARRAGNSPHPSVSPVE